MLQIGSTQALTIFVGNLPTFIAVVLAWMHSNSRTSDVKSALEAKINDKFEAQRKIEKTNGNIDHNKDLLRAEFSRVEEVMDARLKHLEEHGR